MPEIEEAAGEAVVAAQDGAPVLDNEARIAGATMAADLQMALGNGPQAVNVIAEVVAENAPDGAVAPAEPEPPPLDPTTGNLPEIVAAGMSGRYGFDRVTSIHVPSWRVAAELAPEEAAFFQAMTRDVMEPVRAAFGETAEPAEVRIATGYSDSRGRSRGQVFAIQGLIAWLKLNGHKEDSLAIDLTTAGLDGAKPSTQVWRVPGFTFVVTEDRFSRWSPTARKGSTDPVTIWNVYGWAGGLPYDLATLHRRIQPDEAAAAPADAPAAGAEDAEAPAHAPAIALPAPDAKKPTARVDALHRGHQMGRGAVTVRREVRPIGTNAGASLVSLGMKMIENRGYPTYVGHPTAGLEITVFGQYRRPFNLSEEYLVRIEGKVEGQPNGEQRHPSSEGMVDAVSRIFDAHGVKPVEASPDSTGQATEAAELQPASGSPAMQAA